MLLQMTLFHSFYDWVAFHCMYPCVCVCVCVCVCKDFLVGSDGKESACNAGDPGFISGSGRSPGEGNGNPFQYSCLENPMDGGASSMGSQRVGHNWVINTFTFTHTHIHPYTTSALLIWSDGGYLGCFHVLAIVSSAAMNILFIVQIVLFKSQLLWLPGTFSHRIGW